MDGLETGLQADMTNLKTRDVEPRQSLLNSHLYDAQMSWIGGELPYSNTGSQGGSPE